MLHSQETRIDPANLSYSHALNSPWAVDCSTQWDFDSRKTNRKKFRDWAAEPQSEKAAVPSCFAWEKPVTIYPRSGFRDGIPGPEHRITHMKFAFDFLAVHEREGVKNHHCDEQEGVIRMERPGDVVLWLALDKQQLSTAVFEGFLSSAGREGKLKPWTVETGVLIRMNRLTR